MYLTKLYKNSENINTWKKLCGNICPFNFLESTKTTEALLRILKNVQLTEDLNWTLNSKVIFSF